MKRGYHLSNSHFMTLKNLNIILRDLIMTLKDLFYDFEGLGIYLLYIYNHLIRRNKCIEILKEKYY